MKYKFLILLFSLFFSVTSQAQDKILFDIDSISKSILTFDIKNIALIFREKNSDKLLLNIDNFSTERYITPFQYSLSKGKETFGFLIYEKYINYLINNKGVSGAEDINRVLNSNNSTLGFYEALLKSIYSFYAISKIDNEFKYIFKKIVDKTFDRLENVFEGLLYQDMILSLKDINIDYNHLISEYYFCDIVFHNDNLFKKACHSNQILVMCLNDQSNYLDFLSLLSIEDYDLAKYTYSFCKIKQNKNTF